MDLSGARGVRSGNVAHLTGCGDQRGVKGLGVGGLGLSIVKAELRTGMFMRVSVVGSGLAGGSGVELKKTIRKGEVLFKCCNALIVSFRQIALTQSKCQSQDGIAFPYCKCKDFKTQQG